MKKLKERDIIYYFWLVSRKSLKFDKNRDMDEDYESNLFNCFFDYIIKN